MLNARLGPGFHPVGCGTFRDACKLGQHPTEENTMNAMWLLPVWLLIAPLVLAIIDLAMVNRGHTALARTDYRPLA